MTEDLAVSIVSGALTVALILISYAEYRRYRRTVKRRRWDR